MGRAGQAASSEQRPRQVPLFSVHRLDPPGRKKARISADQEPIAAAKIAEALDALPAGPGDLGFCQAAAGGDLLFIKACQQRGVRGQVFLPSPESEFIEGPAAPPANGHQWRARLHAMKATPHDPLRIVPEHAHPLSDGADAYERCNLWLLQSALALGVATESGLSRCGTAAVVMPPCGGGAAQTYPEVERRSSRVTWLDTRTLW